MKGTRGNSVQGDGASLIEAKTYRWRGHWQGDPCNYRTKEEVEEWKKRDPIDGFKKWLFCNKILSMEQAEEIHNEVKRLVDDAEEFAINSAEPNGEELVTDVFA
jgi:TPP-dependent pyruvate/acetoin dehydrogenase alpha subunit